MFLLRIALMAGRSLQANLMRSILACLGVIIGVAAVVSAMSVLEGSRRNVVERIESLGADQIMVFNGNSERQGPRAVSRMSLTQEDAHALAEIPGVIATSAESSTGAQIKYFERNRNVQILATDENYTKINDYHAIQGRTLTQDDVLGSRKYCVLGYKVAQKLYGETPAINTKVRIEGIGFTVIGVMEKKGLLGIRQADTQVIIPVTTGLQRLFGTEYVQNITVQAADADHLEPLIQEVKRTLRREHNIRAGRETISRSLPANSSTNKSVTRSRSSPWCSTASPASRWWSAASAS